MDSQSLLYVMTGAVVVSALALVLQACLLGVMAVSARKMKAQLDELTPKAESLMATAEKTLVDSKKQVDDVTSKAAEVIELTRKQVQRSDEFLTEATGRVRIQLDRAEMVWEDTLDRVHETVVTVNQGLLRPVRELNGFAAGIRAAFEVLLRGGRPSVDQATTDEEMFI